MPARFPRALILGLLLAAPGCRGSSGDDGDGGAASRRPSGSAIAGETPALHEENRHERTDAPPSKDHVVLLAGGDISFGRLVGRMLLRDPGLDFFSSLRPWMGSADVRFANLEGPLSDQKGETVKPGQPLVFTGPPEGAAALARAGFGVVSTANNHAWDYGEPALLETLVHLDRAGIRHAGTGKDREEAWRPAVIDVGGFRVAVIAVTGIWNQGALSRHPADAFVARADADRIAEAVRGARAGADAVVVSYHGGAEYTDEPLAGTRAMLHAAVDAGADVVIGHHPHVIQGVEWYGGRPILYSLGNLLMRMHRDHAWTELGYLARITLRRGGPPGVEACPFRIYGVEIRPFVGDRDRGAYERRFFDHLRAISKGLGGVVVGEPGADGCARIEPAGAPG
jgi:poly-gamma-glutamate synthesis protein (capsule biosynthesis protein)